MTREIGTGKTSETAATVIIGQRVRQGVLRRPRHPAVISGGTRPIDPLVTVVVTHRVNPADVAEFLVWQERLRLAESTFDGFRGTELFRPVEGVQDEWTALYRYTDAESLNRWMVSEERRVLLAEGLKFSDFQSRTIDDSFGSWFAFDETGQQATPPSDLKTSIAVWVGLYPTVVMLSLALSPLHMPLWVGMLVGNLLSSVVMSFVTMPYYVNPLLRRWLRPPPDVPIATTNVRGAFVVIGALALWTVIFYLTTRVLWQLP